MPEDSIMMWVNNEEGLYNDVRRMYDGWVEQGDSWDEADARVEARELVDHIAEAIEGFDVVEGKYTESDKKEAVDEIRDSIEEESRDREILDLAIKRLKSGHRDLENAILNLERLRRSVRR